jgi:hypothetical protein
MPWPSYPSRRTKPKWRPSHPLYRHKKRGKLYRVLDQRALMQCSTAPQFEVWTKDVTFTVYQSLETGAFFIRPTAEFMDGRFEVIDPGEAEDGGR